MSKSILLSTTVSDGMYYEITYNGDKDEIYFDDERYNYARTLFENLDREDASLKSVLGIYDIIPTYGFISTANTWLEGKGVFIPCSGKSYIEIFDCDFGYALSFRGMPRVCI